jgi:hypothetical protein
MECLKNGPPGRMFKKTRLYFELMICDKYRGKNTGRQSVKHELLNRLWSILAVNVLISQ